MISPSPRKPYHNTGIGYILRVIFHDTHHTRGGVCASFVSWAYPRDWRVSQLVTFSRISGRAATPLNRAFDPQTLFLLGPNFLSSWTSFTAMSRTHRIPYPQPNDPLVNLPDLCIDAIFSYFSPIELIRVQRVGPRWRDAVNWRFSRTAQWKRWSPPLGTDDNKLEHASPEETALAFRRAGKFQRFQCLYRRTNHSRRNSISLRNAYTRRTYRYPEIYRCYQWLDYVWGLLHLG